MKKNIWIWSGILTMCFLMSSCSNQQKANNKNFTKAINDYITQEKVCYPLELILQDNVTGSPVFLGSHQIKIVRKNVEKESINQNSLAQMDILVKADLYKKENDENLKVNDSDIPVAVFQRTQAGDTKVLNNNDIPWLCLGKQKVDSIVLFTEPSPYEGMMVSQVVYKSKLMPEGWAEKLLSKRDDNWKNILSESRRKSAILILTNQGWKDKRMF